MPRSNLTDAVSAIAECSEDELRQLHALVSARLGEKVSSSKTRGSDGQKVGGGKGGKSSKGSGDAKRKKGNPQRKSQYSTHPAYKEYRSAKTAVELAAKTEKIPFKDVTGEVRSVYDDALSAWFQAKCGFRASKKENTTSDSESGENPDDEGTGGELLAIQSQESPDASREAPVRARKRTKTGSGPSPASPGILRSPGKYANPPGEWVSSGRDWSSLKRSERRAEFKALASQMEE